eukprot:g70668.t1
MTDKHQAKDAHPEQEFLTFDSQPAYFVLSFLLPFILFNFLAIHVVFRSYQTASARGKLVRSGHVLGKYSSALRILFFAPFISESMTLLLPMALCAALSSLFWVLDSSFDQLAATLQTASLLFYLRLTPALLSNLRRGYAGRRETASHKKCSLSKFVFLAASVLAIVGLALMLLPHYLLPYTSQGSGLWLGVVGSLCFVVCSLGQKTVVLRWVGVRKVLQPPEAEFGRVLWLLIMEFLAMVFMALALAASLVVQNLYYTAQSSASPITVLTGNFPCLLFLLAQFASGVLLGKALRPLGSHALHNLPSPSFSRSTQPSPMSTPRNNANGSVPGPRLQLSTPPRSSRSPRSPREQGPPLADLNEQPGARWTSSEIPVSGTTPDRRDSLLKRSFIPRLSSRIHELQESLSSWRHQNSPSPPPQSMQDLSPVPFVMPHPPEEHLPDPSGPPPVRPPQNGKQADSASQAGLRTREPTGSSHLTNITFTPLTSPLSTPQTPLFSQFGSGPSEPRSAFSRASSGRSDRFNSKFDTIGESSSEAGDSNVEVAPHPPAHLPLTPGPTPPRTPPDTRRDSFRQDDLPPPPPPAHLPFIPRPPPTRPPDIWRDPSDQDDTRMPPTPLSASYQRPAILSEDFYEEDKDNLSMSKKLSASASRRKNQPAPLEFGEEMMTQSDQNTSHDPLTLSNNLSTPAFPSRKPNHHRRSGSLVPPSVPASLRQEAFLGEDDFQDEVFQPPPGAAPTLPQKRSSKNQTQVIVHNSPTSESRRGRTLSRPILSLSRPSSRTNLPPFDMEVAPTPPADLPPSLPPPDTGPLDKNDSDTEEGDSISASKDPSASVSGRTATTTTTTTTATTTRSFWRHNSWLPPSVPASLQQPAPISEETTETDAFDPPPAAPKTLSASARRGNHRPGSILPPSVPGSLQRPAPIGEDENRDSVGPSYPAPTMPRTSDQEVLPTLPQKRGSKLSHSQRGRALEVARQHELQRKRGQELLPVPPPPPTPPTESALFTPPPPPTPPESPLLTPAKRTLAEKQSEASPDHVGLGIGYRVDFTTTPPASYLELPVVQSTPSKSEMDESHEDGMRNPTSDKSTPQKRLKPMALNVDEVVTLDMPSPLSPMVVDMSGRSAVNRSTTTIDHITYPSDMSKTGNSSRISSPDASRVNHITFPSDMTIVNSDSQTDSPIDEVRSLAHKAASGETPRENNEVIEVLEEGRLSITDMRSSRADSFAPIRAVIDPIAPVRARSSSGSFVPVRTTRSRSSSTTTTATKHRRSQSGSFAASAVRTYNDSFAPVRASFNSRIHSRKGSSTRSSRQHSRQNSYSTSNGKQSKQLAAPASAPRQPPSPPHPQGEPPPPQGEAPPPPPHPNDSSLTHRRDTSTPLPSLPPSPVLTSRLGEAVEDRYGFTIEHDLVQNPRLGPHQDQQVEDSDDQSIGEGLLQDEDGDESQPTRPRHQHQESRASIFVFKS